MDRSAGPLPVAPDPAGPPALFEYDVGTYLLAHFDSVAAVAAWLTPKNVQLVRGERVGGGARLVSGSARARSLQPTPTQPNPNRHKIRRSGSRRRRRDGRRHLRLPVPLDGPRRGRQLDGGRVQVGARQARRLSGWQCRLDRLESSALPPTPSSPARNATWSVAPNPLGVLTNSPGLAVQLASFEAYHKAKVAAAGPELGSLMTPGATCDVAQAEAAKAARAAGAPRLCSALGRFTTLAQLKTAL
jgi:hypothetical protein